MTKSMDNTSNLRNCKCTAGGTTTTTEGSLSSPLSLSPYWVGQQIVKVLLIEIERSLGSHIVQWIASRTQVNLD